VTLASVVAVAWWLIALQASVTFDVVSIKPNPTTAPQMVIGTPPGGGLNASAVTPRFLIRFAYAIDNSLIISVPAWAESTRFDVVATGRAGSLDATREMMRAMLADRFRLRAHVETREMPVYVLTTRRADGRLGPQIRESRVPCIARERTAPRPAPPQSLPSSSEAMPCELRMALGHFSGGSVPIDDLARGMSVVLSRNVLDRTGLSGRFDLVLNYTPDSVLLQAPGDADSPPIVTALKEQLGLELNGAREPTEVLVIDSIDTPTPN
jgi:uncharacterized protein (TIGR03435 family)